MIIKSSAESPLYSARFRLVFWLVGIVLFFGFLSLVKGILLPFVVGILAAYFLDPAVRWLRLRGWSRSLSAGVITLSFFAVAVTLCIVLVPHIIQQMSTLLRELPGYMQTLQAKYSDDIEGYIARLSPEQTGTVKNALNNFSNSLVGLAGKMATSVWTSGLALLDLLSLFFLTPVVAFYLLRDWQAIMTRIDHLLPREHAPIIRQQLRAIDSTLSGFIRGQTNVCLLMATYYGLALTLIGLKFGLGLGIMSGVLLFVPFVGIAASSLLAMMIALFQFGISGHLLAVFIVYVIGIGAEGSVITPRLVGDKVGLHPLWIIFGMLSGGALFGLVGVLIAVPVTAVLGVLVRYALSRYLQSPLYSGEPDVIANPTIIAQPAAEPLITL